MWEGSMSKDGVAPILMTHGGYVAKLEMAPRRRFCPAWLTHTRALPRYNEWARRFHNP